MFCSGSDTKILKKSKYISFLYLEYRLFVYLMGLSSPLRFRKHFNTVPRLFLADSFYVR